MGLRNCWLGDPLVRANHITDCSNGVCRQANISKYVISYITDTCLNDTGEIYGRFMLLMAARHIWPNYLLY